MKWIIALALALLAGTLFAGTGTQVQIPTVAPPQPMTIVQQTTTGQNCQVITVTEPRVKLIPQVEYVERQVEICVPEVQVMQQQQMQLQGIQSQQQVQTVVQQQPCVQCPQVVVQPTTATVPMQTAVAVQPTTVYQQPLVTQQQLQYQVQPQMQLQYQQPQQVVMQQPVCVNNQCQPRVMVDDRLIGRDTIQIGDWTVTDGLLRSKVEYTPQQPSTFP